jgi:hypothetical protein
MASLTHRRTPDPTDRVDRSLLSPWRWVAVTAMLAAGAAHLPVIPEHLREAPYLGIAFVAFALACAVGAFLLVHADTRARYACNGVMCVAGVLAYAATRLVAFPQLADDVGNWGEPWGVVAVGTETVCALACAAALRRAGRSQAEAASRASAPSREIAR